MDKKTIASTFAGILIGSAATFGLTRPLPPARAQVPSVIEAQQCACFDPKAGYVTKMIPKGKPPATSDCGQNEQIRCGRYLSAVARKK